MEATPAGDLVHAVTEPALRIDGTRARVLLVERPGAVRDAIQHVLEPEGYEVTVAETLAELPEDGAVDSTVALVSWNLMRGANADAHRLHLRRLGARLPVVLMVSSGGARVLDAADLGVAAVLAKPFDADRLLAVLTSL